MCYLFLGLVNQIKEYNNRFDKLAQVINTNRI